MMKEFGVEWREHARLVVMAALVGTVGGLVAAGFRFLIFAIQNLALFGRLSFAPSSALDHTRGWWLPLVTAAGGLAVGLLTYFLAPEASGHGVPEVMEANALRGGRLRPRLIGIKALASAITIGSGGAAGREGPIVQIGSAAGSTLADLLHTLPHMRKVLVACGAAAGIAATFNTPIAGVLFSIELVLLELKTTSFVPLVVASVFGTMVSRVLLGRTPTFVVPEYAFEHNVELLFYLGLGLLAGLAAVLLTVALYRMEDVLSKLPGPAYLRPAVGGLLLGLVGLAAPQILGVGYETVGTVLRESYGGWWLLGLAALKIVALSLTLGSGGSGGVFAPCLFVGAGLGGAFGTVVHHFWPAMTASYGAYALVGMAAVFAGASRATLTSIIILFEMTRDYRIILPLMFACVLSELVAWTIHRDTVYTTKLARRGVRIVQDLEVAALARLRVADVMSRDLETVLATASVRDAYDKILSTGHQALPVVDREGRLTGIVTHFDLSAAFQRHDAERPVGELARREMLTAHPDQSLRDVIGKLSQVGQVPVVDRGDPRRLLGMLARIDLVKASGPGTPEAG